MRKITILLDEVELPDNIHGVASKGDNAYYVLLDSKDSKERREAALVHEVLHIYRNDYESGKSADEIEKEIREETKTIKQYL